MNLRELKPRGELDKYIDNPRLDEDSQRPVESLWETQAGLTVQPRREPWARTKTQAETLGPKDGIDGDDGIDGIDGQDGEDGAQGPEGPAGSDATLPSGIIVFATVADLGDGWQLCDGTNGTPDLRDKFVVTVGPSYSYGDSGGFKWHGQTENNHNDHYLRHITHAQDGVEYDLTTGVCLQFPGSDNVVTSISLPDCDIGDDGTWGVAAWCGPSSGTLPDSQKPTDDHYAEHYGPYNGNLDTDNRPPYIALYAHMKL